MDPRLRDELLEILPACLAAGEGAEARAAALPTHLRATLEADPRAEAAWRRMLAQACALRGLSRQEVPQDLEGRVVAAMQPGARQERAVQAVRGLPERPIPDELEAIVRRRVEQPFRLPEVPAPAVLDRLVAEDFEDLPKAIVGRLAGRLPRKVAPGALARRLEAVAVGSGDPPAPVSWMVPVIGLVATIALVWTLGLGAGSKQNTESVPRRFEIVRVDPRAAAQAGDPAVAFLSALGGGVWEGAVR